MARFLNIALIFVAAAMYMAFAAPSPQTQNPPPLAPPGNIPEGPANNYTGPPPQNCTEFVEKCTKFTGNEQVTAGGSNFNVIPIYAEISKYDCTKLSASCNGTAPAPPPTPNIPQNPPAPGGQQATPPPTF